MPQNKHSFKNSLFIVIVAYQTKLNISRKKRATKILPKRLHSILNYLCNAIKKTLGEISLHRHFKACLNIKHCGNGKMVQPYEYNLKISLKKSNLRPDSPTPANSPLLYIRSIS
jgi:hypothetical protein